MQNILILGASGMLGHKLLEHLSSYTQYNVYGTVTQPQNFGNSLPSKYETKIIDGVFADKIKTVENTIIKIKPDVVINAIGIIKQYKDGKGTVNSIIVNALFPHQVADVCSKYNARFITIATDCVFDGTKTTPYCEEDEPSCHDIYGMTKYLGEVKDGKALTLRTSIIGHELHTNLSLLDWFLSQTTTYVKGYQKALFSGFTTLEFAKLLGEKIIPSPELSGLYHISVNPISKFDLLQLVSKMYAKKIDIISDDNISINRALNSDKLRKIINYAPPTWELLIKNMYQDFIGSEFYKIKRSTYENTNAF